MAEMETKAFGPFEIKDASRGEVEAVVNTLNIVDRDGDVLLPGAIRDGSMVKMSGYGHDTILDGEPPAGLGTVTVKDNRAVVSGRFFMGTTRGREAFEVVKEMGPHGEWSIGYRNVKTADLTPEWKEAGAKRVIASLDLIEVSPVFEGANQATGTLAVKAAEPEPEPEADIKEAERLAAETEAKAQAEASEARAAALRALWVEEQERFQRTMRRFGVR